MADVRRVRIDHLKLTGVPRHRQREVTASIERAVRETASAAPATHPDGLKATLATAIAAALTPRPGGSRP